MDLGAIERKPMSTQVAEQLLALIRHGHYRPGDSLPTERELCARLGVGRSTVREAMRWLVVAGVVDVRPGRGAVVTSVSPERVAVDAAVSAVLDRQALEELGEVRRILEPEVAALAAQRATAAERLQVQEQAAALAAAADPLDEERFIAADLAFHAAVARGCHNVVLERMMRSVQDLLWASRRRTIRVPGAAGRAEVGHRRIAAAVARGDPRAARAAMRAHLADSQADLARSWDRPAPGPSVPDGDPAQP